MSQMEKAANGTMQGFQGSAANVGELAKHGGTASAVAREESEVKAAIVLARANRREEMVAYRSIMKACQRPTFAASAIYSFPRGQSQITGPSVDLAREMARVWGNIRCGFRVVTEDETTCHIKGYAHDLETNAYVEMEDKFRKLIQRKQGKGENAVTKWVVPDERDLRELVNRRAAFLERNCILKLMPPDYIDDALNQVFETKEKAANGELTADRSGTLKKMVMAFDEIRVSAEMLADYLGHAIEDVTDRELSELRGICKSIRDGNSEREEYFILKKPTVEEAPPKGEQKPAGDAAAEKLKGKGKKPAPEPEPIPKTDGPMSGADIDAAMRGD